MCEKPPSELLAEIEEVVRRYPGVEMPAVELERVSSSSRPPVPRAGPPHKKAKKG